MLEKMCLSEGMSKLQASIYFVAVDIFGEPSWAKDRGRGEYQPEPKIGDFWTLSGYSKWHKAGQNIYL
jgi:hypothetical protein